MARSRSSQLWLKEPCDAPCVETAQKDGCRSRASDKLLEILGKERILRPGMTVVDLGAVPSGHLLDLVISQMAPNMSGVKAAEQPRAMYQREPAPGAASVGRFPDHDFPGRKLRRL